MNDRRRPRVPAKPKASPQLTGPVQLDDETRNALILFNARLVAQDELEKEKRRVDKAAKAKDEAAAKVRELENNPKATAEQKSEAQAAYLASLDTLNRAKAGEPEAAAAETDAADETPEPEAETDAADETPEPEAAAETPEATADETEVVETPEAAEAPEAEVIEASEPEVTETPEVEVEVEVDPAPEGTADEPEAGDES